MQPQCTMRKPRVIDLMSLISAHQLTQTPAWAVCVHNKWRTHITARCRWVTSGGGAAWQSFKTCLNGFVCYRRWSQRPEGEMSVSSSYGLGLFFLPFFFLDYPLCVLRTTSHSVQERSHDGVMKWQRSIDYLLVPCSAITASSQHDGVTHKTTITASPWDTISTLFLHTHSHTNTLKCSVTDSMQ